jgi:hypothetical protein
VIPALTNLREAGSIELDREGKIDQGHKVRLKAANA